MLTTVSLLVNLLNVYLNKDTQFHENVCLIGATMLGLVKSCIGTKFTGQFGDLISVSVSLLNSISSVG